MKFTAMLIAASTVAAAAPALAQNVADRSAPTYGGLRLEGRIGYEFVNSGVRSTREFGERGVFGDDASNEAPVIGAEVGYDRQFGGIVVGGYAGLELSDTNIGSAGRPFRFNTDHNATIGVRAGVPLNPGALLYVKGGYSRGRLRVSEEGTNPALFDDYDKDRDGYHVGGGAELPFGTRFYGRADYVFHRYESFEVTTADTLKFSRHQLVGAIGVRF